MTNSHPFARWSHKNAYVEGLRILVRKQVEMNRPRARQYRRTHASSVCRWRFCVIRSPGRRVAGSGESCRTSWYQRGLSSRKDCSSPTSSISLSPRYIACRWPLCSEMSAQPAPMLVTFQPLLRSVTSCKPADIRDVVHGSPVLRSCRHRKWKRACEFLTRAEPENPERSVASCIASWRSVHSAQTDPCCGQYSRRAEVIPAEVGRAGKARRKGCEERPERR